MSSQENQEPKKVGPKSKSKITPPVSNYYIKTRTKSGLEQVMPLNNIEENISDHEEKENLKSSANTDKNVRNAAIFGNKFGGGKNGNLNYGKKLTVKNPPTPVLSDPEEEGGPFYGFNSISNTNYKDTFSLESQKPPSPGIAASPKPLETPEVLEDFDHDKTQDSQETSFKHGAVGNSISSNSDKTQDLLDDSLNQDPTSHSNPLETHKNHQPNLVTTSTHLTPTTTTSLNKTLTLKPNEAQTPSSPHDQHKTYTATNTASPRVSDIIRTLDLQCNRTQLENNRPPSQQNLTTNSNETLTILNALEKMKTEMKTERKTEMNEMKNEMKTDSQKNKEELQDELQKNKTSIETFKQKLDEDSRENKEWRKTQEKTLEKVNNTLLNLEHVPTQIEALENKTSELDTNYINIQTRVAQNEENINQIRENPTLLTDSQIKEIIKKHLDAKDIQDHWQRELDNCRNGIIFKNLKRTPGSTEQDPLQAYKDNIIGKMNLSLEDFERATPTHIKDAHRGKPDVDTHFFICSYLSPNTISIFRQNARSIPRGVSFQQKTPYEFKNAQKEFMNIQRTLKELKNKDNFPLCKTRLTHANGHLILERQDRISIDAFTPWYPYKSFIPTSNEYIPKATVENKQQDYILNTFRWSHPKNQVEQETLISKISGTQHIEKMSFNRTGHILTIVMKNTNTEETLTSLKRDPNIAQATMHTHH